MTDRRSRRASASAAAALAFLTASLAGCSSEGSGTEPSAAPSVPPEISSYVAVGDSFTAAPYVPQTDLAAGCLRSSGNYPSLLAAALDAELTDVSCSGATSADLTAPQTVGFGQTTVPAQVDAVRPDTDLVTVGIGGNDANFFATLVLTCTGLAEQEGSPCLDQLEAQSVDPAATAKATGRRVAEKLEAVRRAAPQARLVLVGYPRIVSPDQPCAQMPLADGDRPALAALEEELDAALAGAAAAVGAEFLGLRELSEGHEVCSPDPWINGGTTDEQRALAYHPFAVEQQAVATALEELLAATPATPATPTTEAG